MFKHLLVPLDGSKLAESILPLAVSLAEVLHAPVILLHIIEQDASPEIHHDRHLTNPGEAQEYLDEIKRTFFPATIVVDTHIHIVPALDVAESIIEHANQEFKPDLILLCSHGKSGMSELLFGSIAQKVAATGSIPVLLVRPSRSIKPFMIQRILVPLDNESNHDLALPVAESLSRAYNAGLDLLCVIPTLATDSGSHAAAGTLLPATAVAYLDIAEEMAGEHFQVHLNEFERIGIPATAEIVRGDPATMIARFAEKKGSDVILLGTHGRSGMEAFWNRSVTARVAQKTRIPLLLIPLADQKNISQKDPGEK
jgi:nucleotide-binding universal stress UspA family protein